MFLGKSYYSGLIEFLLFHCEPVLDLPVSILKAVLIKDQTVCFLVFFFIIIIFMENLHKFNP